MVSLKKLSYQIIKFYIQLYLIIFKAESINLYMCIYFKIKMNCQFSYIHYIYIHFTLKNEDDVIILELYIYFILVNYRYSIIYRLILVKFFEQLHPT